MLCTCTHLAQFLNQIVSLVSLLHVKEEHEGDAEEGNQPTEQLEAAVAACEGKRKGWRRGLGK